MPKFSNLVVALAAGFFAAGCGASADNDLSEADSKVAAEATSRALKTANIAGALVVSASRSAACTGGGNIDIKAKVSTSGDSADLEFEIEFDDCSTDGVKINGKMKYLLYSQVSDSTVSLKFEWDGDLFYSGSINGSCEAKFTASISSSATGGSAEVSGTFCGHEGNFFNQVAF